MARTSLFVDITTEQRFSKSRVAKMKQTRLMFWRLGIPQNSRLRRFDSEQLICQTSIHRNHLQKEQLMLALAQVITESKAVLHQNDEVIASIR